MLCSFIFITLNHFSQKTYFIDYRELADSLDSAYEIPACIILSVAYIESGGGTSNIGRKLNNHFGIKGKNDVSISGYHIAEAGANPITQLAFTLANGFTYVEYYLSRGMNIDDFAPNLSFFFARTSFTKGSTYCFTAS